MTDDPIPDVAAVRAGLNARKTRVRVAAWQTLAGCGDIDPALAAELACGLADSHVLVRLAAARAVPAFAARAGHLVPLLIRRRFDGDARVRQAAAVGLAWVLPGFADVPRWATELTRRDANPVHNVFRLCRRARLSDVVRAELRAAFERRRRWHLDHAGAPMTEEAFVDLWALARASSAAAMRPGWPARTRAMARWAEFAWQLAYAWELCHNAPMRPGSSTG